MTILMRDDFTKTGSDVDRTIWTTPTGDAGFIPRTAFRNPLSVAGNSDLVPVAGGLAHLTLSTHNPTAITPGDSFWGSQIASKQEFGFGTDKSGNAVVGLEFSARVRLPADPPPGLVFSLFGYSLNEPGPGHDEIDIELLSNYLQPGVVPFQILFNRYDDEPEGAGHPLTKNLPAGFDPTAFHTLSIRYFQSGRIEWLVDDARLAARETFVPSGPLSAHLNVWAPDASFATAFDAALQPVASADANVDYQYLVDWVRVASTSTEFFDNPATRAMAAVILPGAGEPVVPIFFNNQLIGGMNHHAVEIYDRTPNGTGYPTTLVDIVANTFFRLTVQNSEGGTARFGTSIVGSISYWLEGPLPESSDDVLRFIPTVDRADIALGAGNSYTGTVRGHYGVQANTSSTHRFTDASLDMTVVTATNTLTVLEPIDLVSSADAIVHGNVLRLLTLSTMYINSATFDASLLLWRDPSGVVHSLDFSDLPHSSGYLFATPRIIAAGSWIELVKGAESTWFPDSPTMRVAITNTYGLQIAVQGFRVESSDPNDDNVSVWVEVLNPPDILAKGTSLKIDYTVGAVAPLVDISTYRSPFSSTLPDAPFDNLELTGSGKISGTGNASNNIITGNGQANLLAGGLGADTLNGNDGADTVHGEGGDDSLSGADGIDSLTGGEGNDQLAGGAGRDLLAGGPGNDLYRIDGTGNYDVIIEAPGAGGGVDTVAFKGLTVYTLPFGVEHLVAEAPALIVGNVLDNVLTGSEGNDSLQGGNGNDTLSGAGGNDILDGGAGLDSLAGGTGDDSYTIGSFAEVERVAEAVGEGSDRLVLTFAAPATVDLSMAALSGIEHVSALAGGTWTLHGNDAANHLIGNVAADKLSGGNGSDTLDGGLGADTMTGGADNDTFVVDQAGDVVIETPGGGVDTVRINRSLTLTDGADPFDHVENIVLTGAAALGAGGDSQDNVIVGNDAANKLSGGAGNDSLQGAGGADTLDGGSGNDALSGGDGNDLYLVDSKDDSVSESAPSGGSADTVRSTVDLTLTAHVEHLVLLESALNGGGNAGRNSLLGNAQANELLGQEENDTVVGAAANDTLAGGSGNDSLDGGEGDDSLDGGSGRDMLRGGAGNDTYVVDGGAPASFDTALETIAGKAGGEDTVLFAGSGTFVLPLNVEHFTIIATGAASVLGNSLDNMVVGGEGDNQLGGGAGSDTIVGAGGNDRLDGGAGVDSLAGGGGDDEYVIDSAAELAKVVEAQDEGADRLILQFAAPGLVDLASTALEHFEHVTLVGAGGAQLAGNGADNHLVGNATGNKIEGLAGNDTLDGGVGADTLVGGEGNDTYVIDQAGDKVSEAGGEGEDTIVINRSVTLSDAPNPFSNTEHVRLSGAAALAATGDSTDNALTGNVGANSLAGSGGSDTISGGQGADTLDGGSGNDAMLGGEGGDLYFVDSTDDSVVESAAASGGIDEIRASVAFTLPTHVENLRLLDTASTGQGNAANNVLSGTPGANTLAGLESNDTLVGDQGDDLLEGGAGNDSLAAGEGNDTLSGGPGKDTLAGGTGNDSYLVDGVSPATFDTVVESLAGAAGGTDTVRFAGSGVYALPANVEHLVIESVGGGSGIGNTLANSLLGGGGNDLLTGGAGAAADTLAGSAGSDTLDGGGGNDSMSGGEGADVFRFTTAAGAANVDTIDGFAAAIDKLHFENAVFVGLGAATGVVAAAAFNFGAGLTTAQDASDRLIFDTSTGRLYYDANGNAPGAAVLVAELGGALALSASDILVI